MARASPSAGLMTVAAALLLAGCAAPGRYMGLSLASPEVPAEVRDLARRAQAGDKQAQLELGIAFEEGRGVAHDLRKARRLYAQAARDSGRPMWVYAPSAVPGRSGRLVQVNAVGLAQFGLVEAQRRLQQVDAPVVERRLEKEAPGAVATAGINPNRPIAPDELRSYNIRLEVYQIAEIVAEALGDNGDRPLEPEALLDRIRTDSRLPDAYPADDPFVQSVALFTKPCPEPGTGLGDFIRERFCQGGNTFYRELEVWGGPYAHNTRIVNVDSFNRHMAKWESFNNGSISRIFEAVGYKYIGLIESKTYKYAGDTIVGADCIVGALIIPHKPPLTTCLQTRWPEPLPEGDGLDRLTVIGFSIYFKR